MKAAVLKQTGTAPVYEDFPDPVPAGDQQLLIHIKTASVKNLDKARAAGTHYANYTQLPVVVGIDGVGTLEDGTLVYAQGISGTIAEKAIIHKGQYIVLPPGINPDVAAALPNAILGSAMALRYRAQLQAGQTVLINGATGVTGMMAVQLAKLMGARKVIATGRNARQLEKAIALGADDTISLLQTDAAITEQVKQLQAQTPVDIVLDYLWGKPTALILDAFRGGSVHHTAGKIKVVTVGAMAGDALPVSSAALRSADIELMGSGFGSLTPKDFDAFNKTMLPEMFERAAAKQLKIDLDIEPLINIEAAWNKPLDAGKRLVIEIS
ncbi:zinc-binding alcohol dehydrogenase family protein [Niabella sp.]|uniref:quinone oxidoreductase family protein n=1 Tax=Niabella sp. TaxID=1962976 RepID=UPI0026153679|nr:zinc-binding alcohol dehydrogenase family protein [Niabella sp.]